jgi:peptidoglycan-N-acetylglucosamine deacetylase
MKRIKHSLIQLVLSISICIPFLLAQDKSSVCFTFDDGNPKDLLNYKYDQWNQMILDQLKEHKLQAILYVCGRNLNNKKGRQILENWDKAGHIIANHTYNHLNYNNAENNYDKYTNDILRCDSLINGYSQYQKYFRAPFLKYGDTKSKRDSLNTFLRRINYKNGYVTIDASDWLYNSKLLQYMEQHPGKSIEQYRKAYIKHLIDRAGFYDTLAYRLLGRKIKHSILLHHNLTSALFLADLMKAFEHEGWQLINAGDALKDEVYQMVPDIVPAGESIIWGLAKETGRYDTILRYPGEDSQYEEETLKKLGL